jgi:hypothetical protein
LSFSLFQGWRPHLVSYCFEALFSTFWKQFFLILKINPYCCENLQKWMWRWTWHFGQFETFFVFNSSSCAYKWQKNQVLMNLHLFHNFCQFLWLLIINIQCFVVEGFSNNPSNYSPRGCGRINLVHIPKNVG